MISGWSASVGADGTGDKQDFFRSYDKQIVLSPGKGDGII
jgi:hypothetical protein